MYKDDKENNRNQLNEWLRMDQHRFPHTLWYLTNINANIDMAKEYDTGEHSSMSLLPLQKIPYPLGDIIFNEARMVYITSKPWYKAKDHATLQHHTSHKAYGGFKENLKKLKNIRKIISIPMCQTFHEYLDKRVTFLVARRQNPMLIYMQIIPLSHHPFKFKW